MSTKHMKHIRRQRQNRHRIRIVILVITILSCMYMLGQRFCDWEWLTETVATIIAIVAAVAFWLEYHENKLLNEAQFIMELNEQFLSDSNLSEVEWELEKYYNRYRKDELTEEYCVKFEEQFDLEKRKRQHLVNYLVHLEGIAALVNNVVLHLDAIDDLMSYRYFIAVNNPIVQKLELLEYPDYYKGCFGIYDAWVAELQEQGVIIPMYDEDKNDLTKKLEEQKKCKQKRN